ncbi:MAG: serine hydrolase [Planctomycetes bacterium]|nr:serine hydrolase [Planctomycetota bacterium]
MPRNGPGTPAKALFEAQLRKLGYHGQVVDVTPQQEWGDPMAYLTPTEPFFEAGTTYQYNDHGVHLLGSILTRLAGEPLKDFFKRRIADPIGMTDWDWGVCGTVEGIALNNPSGVHGTGIRTTARQMARLGYLYLNRGRWNGRQLLPADFVDEAARNQVPLTARFRNLDLRGRYGLYWWTNGVQTNGKRPWASAPPGAFTMHGHNCNFCYVIPEWDMVVVRMGTQPIGRSPAQEPLWDTFFAKMAEAVARGGAADK